jgi:2-methylcitrate dehydratase PrpD
MTEVTSPPATPAPMAATAPGITARLAARSEGLRFSSLPPDVLTVAKQCLIDWLGVTLAGGTEPVSKLVRAELAAQGGHEQATVVGTPLRLSAYQAAIANGTAAHALDYDDVLATLLGHPSAPIWATVLALAEAENLTGRDCLTAFVAGVEVASALGRLTTPPHYQRGFHTTGTICSVGAAAAAARLLGLDQAATATALGLGATQAAGLKAVFGTMSKPFHSGKAAGNGVLAASLARRGMTSSTEIIEAPRGFALAMAGGLNPGVDLDAWAGSFDVTGMLFKFHASCYHTHSAIEGALALRADGLRPDEVERITLRITPTHLGTCAIPEPVTGLEGKFSLRFATALALAEGLADETRFTDEMVARPDLTALRDRVELTVDESLTEEFATEVTVHTTGGAVRTARVDVGQPAPRGLETQGRGLEDKFVALASPRIGAARAGQVLAAVSGLEDAGPIAGLAALVATNA